MTVRADVARRPVISATDHNRKTLEAVARQLERYLQSNGRNLKFSVDDSAGALVVQVHDASSGELIRQYPSEEALVLMRRLNEASGTLLDLTA